jgi:tripeptidyl-peptidase-1
MIRCLSLLALIGFVGALGLPSEMQTVAESLSGSGSKWHLPLTSRLNGEHFHLIGSASSDTIHSVKIEVKLKNLDLLKRFVEDVSNPFHEDYGKHLTKEQLGDMITNHEAVVAVERYLSREGAIVKGKTPNGEFIEAEASINSWERIFSTRFFEYHHKKTKNVKVHRAHEFTLPMELRAHVESVFEVIDLPPLISGGPVFTPIGESNNRSQSTERNAKSSFLRSEINLQKTTTTGYVTPSLLNSHYSISSNTGNSFTTQSALACIGQWLDTRDLTIFQNYFGLSTQGISSSVGGNLLYGACAIFGLSNCIESNLDFQYLMAIAQKIPTISLYNQNCDYVSFFASLTNPPKVISISYGGPESSWGSTYSNAFNTVAMQLAAMGVTIVVASGDDGAAGWTVETSSACAYTPQFPASSPYVLTVGATQVSFLLFSFSFFFFVLL